MGDNFSGFNETDAGWILNDGNFLDIHDLLMTRQQTNEDGPKESQSFGAVERKSGHKKTKGRQDSSDEISTEQLLGVVGGSIGITLSFVIFVTFIMYVLSGSKRTKKSCNNYVKMDSKA